MRLNQVDHPRHPWRIHEVAAGFAVEDVWALDTPGQREDFPSLVDRVWSSVDHPPQGGARLLLTIRWKLGQWWGWDGPAQGLGRRVAPLAEGLPPDLRATRTPDVVAQGVPFSPLYQLENEWAAELANGTVHGVLHLGWVPSTDQRYRGQLAVLVRPNGRAGQIYLAAIKPWRLLIYPAWIRRIERSWAP